MKFSVTCQVVRVMLGWKQEQLAEALNVSVPTVSAWEADKRAPHPSTVRMLIILSERHGLVWNQRGYPEYREDGPFVPDQELPEGLRCFGFIEDLTHCTSNACGIYFLVLEDEVVYVGQSVDSNSRLITHTQDMERGPIGRWREPKRFDRAFLLRWSPADLDRVEGAFIRKFRPRFNRSIPKEIPEGADEELLALLRERCSSVTESLFNERGYPEYERRD